MVIPARFDYAWGFADNGLASVELDGKWGFIDKTGEMVIPVRFDEAWNLTDNGLVQVKLEGFINESGSTIVPTIFDGASYGGTDYLSAFFGEKEYPILLDGSFLGFSRADVTAEYERIAEIKRREEEYLRPEQE